MEETLGTLNSQINKKRFTSQTTELSGRNCNWVSKPSVGGNSVIVYVRSDRSSEKKTKG